MIDKMNGKRTVLRLLFSATVLLFLIYTVGIQDIAAMAARGNLTLILVALVIALCDRVLMAYKWNLLLRARNIQVALVGVTRVYLISTFLGLFLPATIGADALRAYAVSKGGNRIGDIISSIIVERVIGVLALLVFALVSVSLSFVVFGPESINTFLNVFWLTIVLLAILLALFYLSLSKSRLFTSLARLLNAKLHRFGLAKKLAEIYLSYQEYRRHLPHLLVFFVLSLAENVLPILSSYLLALAFEMRVALLYFFILVPIVLILVRLPISLDGIGLQEGAYVYFLSLVGVMQSEALFLGIATHALAVLSVLPGAAFYCFRGLELKDVSKNAKRDERSVAVQGP